MTQTSLRTMLMLCTAAVVGGARADVCTSLQQQYLAAGGGGSNATTIHAAADVAALNRSLQAAQASAQQNHCTGFSLFGPRPAPNCNLITQEVNRLQAQVRAAYEGGDARGQDSGFFANLFGYSNPRSPADQARDALAANGCAVPQNPARGSAGGSKTLCIRTCDGYYFPVESGVSSDRFQADAQVCATLYGDVTKAQLFVMPNDGDVGGATPLNGGKPYRSQPYAFAYRRTYDAACAAQLRSGVNSLAALSSLPPAIASLVTASGPPVSFPEVRGSRFEDPETLANRTGNPSTVDAAVSAPSHGIRVVGAAYYNLILDRQAAGLHGSEPVGEVASRPISSP